MLKGKHIVLCGYNWAGCKALDLLLNQGATVEVFTHEPDWHVPSLLAYAKKKNIKVSTDDVSVNELESKPELLCSIYYRNKIKANVISYCNNGGINLHPSLLPKYRGCSSLTWAIVNGEPETGFSYHYLNENFDDGDILLQEKIHIEDYDLQVNLYQRTMFLAMDRFIDAVMLAMNNYPGKPQLGAASYNKRGAPFSGEINERWDDVKVERFIRAMTNPPYPTANFKGDSVPDMKTYFRLKGKRS